MILGNDVSLYQGKIDFKKMKSAGSQFVYMRAGLGSTKDKNYEEYKIGAKEAGIPWGHYWVPLATPYTQSMLDAYFEIIGNDWGDLPPTLDVETSGLGLGVFKMWIDQTEPKWVATLLSGTSYIRKKLTFYTRASHFDQYQDTKNLKAYIGEHTNLWVAHYTYDPINKPPIISTNTWSNYLIHQYSADENKLGSKYGVSSIPIDMDYFNSESFSFEDWSGIQEGTTPIPIPTDRYVKIVAKQWNGKGGWLFFRDKPDFNSDAFLATGYGETIKLVDMNIVNGHWHVERGGFSGWVSAGTKYTQLIA